MISFSNTYSKLPGRFYERVTPTAAPNPTLIEVNDELALELGIDPAWLRSDKGLAVLSGQQIAEGSEPLAQAYSGHQFGGFSPQLGDGRACLLGEVIDLSKQHKDIQLKGSGRTPFSRNGDGKSALGPVIREYLISEAMYALGVPTTRALAAVRSGENVNREKPMAGGVFTRVASSHLRIGTFQYYAARKDSEALTILTNYALERHYKTCNSDQNPAITLLENVISAQAKLVAHWMSIGFIHGVMNTDNCSISGETIDYGPCAFMDDFHPGCVFSAIDRDARYAWGNQASIAHWNLTRLAEALLPIVASDEAEATKLVKLSLDGFSKQFVTQYNRLYKAKFGLSAETSSDFIRESLSLLADQQVDYTLFFRKLTQLAHGKIESSKLTELFLDEQVAIDWINQWQTHQDAANVSVMLESNPILIPRNHQVEAAIQQAYQGDYTLFHKLHNAWKFPFTETQGLQDLEKPPLPEERVTQTFCGT